MWLKLLWIGQPKDLRHGQAQVIEQKFLGSLFLLGGQQLLPDIHQPHGGGGRCLRPKVGIETIAR